MKAILLIGSPKGLKSSSESLGMYLIERLKDKGLEWEKIYVHRTFRAKEDEKNLLTIVNSADIIILAFPLYVDSLPAPVMKAMEIIAQFRSQITQTKKRFVAIANCGFPESSHNDIALSICRKFAQEVGFEWSGGFALGGGGALGGKSLQESGGMVRNVIKALNITADALANDKPIPQEAIEMMAKPLIPRWLYLMFGNIGWKRESKKFGVSPANLYKKPSQPEKAS